MPFDGLYLRRFGIFLIECPRLTLSIVCPLRVLYLGANHIIQIYSGITCGRVLNDELYTQRLRFVLSIFVYRL